MAEASDGTDDAQATKLLRIADLIRARTYDRVQNLAVTFARDSSGVLLSGQVHTFYVKQLAQHAALEEMRGEKLYNQIEVRHAAEISPPPAHAMPVTEKTET
jgi:osmotically-inducible protein OsmY